MALLEFEHGALAAYVAAIERLEDATLAAQVDEFRAEHERRVVALDEVASALGLKVSGSTVTSALASGKIALADIAGDKGVLQAIRTSERAGAAVYQEGSTSAEASEATSDISTEAHASSMRQGEWLTREIDRLECAG